MDGAGMRRWLLERLVTDPSIAAMVSDRIFQGESATTNLIEKPFIFYTIGNATDEQLSEEGDRPYRQFFQIYIHDAPADYTKIDSVVKLVKDRLQNARSTEYNVMTVNHLETSRDLDDDTMGTIFRYCRFQAIMRR